jgi:hypothetical protein
MKFIFIWAVLPVYITGYNDFDLFTENGTLQTGKDAKWNSKTHEKKMFSIF